MKKRAVIDVTDLYHPHQDCGDNIDLITPYAMEEIDLKAVILDVTDQFRHKDSVDVTGAFVDPGGPRDGGIIPVNQLNYIFDRCVPCGMSPFTPMRSLDDTMDDAPRYQQQGVNLILDTLRNAGQKVSFAMFGSCRAVAAAFNRDPDLFFEKVEGLYINAGSSHSDFLEWNVNLDPKAYVRLLRSGLPVFLYPCAGADPFTLERHNTYWKCDDFHCIKEMDRPLQSYLAYAMNKDCRSEFLYAMEQQVPADLLDKLSGSWRCVWETAVWLELTGRRLVQKQDGTYAIIPGDQMAANDRQLAYGMKNCALEVFDNGAFKFELIDKDSTVKLFYRDDPEEYQCAMNQAFHRWHAGFKVNG